MLLHSRRVLPLTEDVDEVGGGYEIKARELLSLRLKIVRERSVAQIETGGAAG